ncbi:MAG: hypothetical protein H6Q99_4204 [Proteobacteria bacterium]|nr:hypothetical protein [Pseudomonadota bacterium]
MNPEGARLGILTVSRKSTRYLSTDAFTPTMSKGREMVSFSPAAFDAFLAEDDDSPVVMLNLLRFQPDGGRERYLKYLQLAEPILARFGAKILFGGDGLPVLTTGEAQGWDAVALVQYPRRSAFKAMVDDPQYQAAFQVGQAAIADIVLQPLKRFDHLK